MTKPILTITQVARRLGISTRTIRVYAEEGFIRLERQGNRCLVEIDQVENIVMIERLKTDLGVNLAGVGVILEMRKKIETLQERLDRLQQELDRQIREFQRLPAARGKREIMIVEVEED